MYRDVDGPTKPVGDLNLLCSQRPVHIIFGKINDVVYVRLSVIAFAYPCVHNAFFSSIQLSESSQCVDRPQIWAALCIDYQT